MAENGNLATFAYTADGDRAKMLVSKNGTDSLTRYYLGGQYEFDQTLGGTKEKLYLGGDSYSAAAVYVKSNSGSWQVYYIGRDYQGSITHVLDANGSTVQELSYDPWGRLRNPNTQVVYAVGAEPALFLGRGYTGHEHLAAFGLINMNARLYDPALGRFLSPDPYVQAPDFSQNFNRYSYCLNNPLRFTDKSGKWIHILIGAVVGGTFNLVYKAATGQIHSLKGGLVAFGIGAVAGGLGAATGGLAFAAAGGASGGIGGFFAGAASGAMGSAVSMGVQNVGNHFTFGDPWLKPKDYGVGILVGAVTGGVVNGVSASLNGRNFWDGKLPTPVLDKLTMPSASLLQAQSEVQTPEIESPNVPGETSQALTSQNSLDQLSQTSLVKSPDGRFIVTKEGVVLPKGAQIPNELVENPYRSGSYGVIDEGKFIEKLRIDAATAPGMKGPNISHFHLNGGREHIFDISRWPW